MEETVDKVLSRIKPEIIFPDRGIILDLGIWIRFFTINVNFKTWSSFSSFQTILLVSGVLQLDHCATCFNEFTVDFVQETTDELRRIMRIK